MNDVDTVRAAAHSRGFVLSDDEAAAVAEQLRGTHESLEAAAARDRKFADEPVTRFDPSW